MKKGDIMPVQQLKKYENERFGEERALYGACGVYVNNCSFDGPEDGESALKEARDIVVENTLCNLRYPFWHDTSLVIRNCEMTPLCRAALWYSEAISIEDTKLHGIKALRECRDVSMKNCDITSAEFGWFTKGLSMEDCHAEGEYFLLKVKDLHLKNSTLHGKYSFQYAEGGMIESCNLDTKDAFWHTKNLTVKNSVVRGEYLAWYSENLTLINCKIIGTQPLCYCKNLRFENCEMLDADLAFEKSEVYATLTSAPVSIKNPTSGSISIPAPTEIIMDDPNAKCKIEVNV